jgi:hypothetical protein
MKRSLAAASLGLALSFAVPAGAQTPAAGQTPAQAQPSVAMVFEAAAYVTCREAHAMPVDGRRQLAIFLAEHSARYHGVIIPDDERGGQLALLIRGGCTLAPDAHLFAVVDKAIVAEMSKLPKRQ